MAPNTRESECDGGGESKGLENDEFVVERHDDADRVSLNQRLSKEQFGRESQMRQGHRLNN